MYRVQPFIRFVFYFDTVLATMTINDRYNHKHFLTIILVTLHKTKYGDVNRVKINFPFKEH